MSVGLSDLLGSVPKVVGRNRFDLLLELTDAEELRQGVEALRAACTEIQRDPQGVEVSCMWTGKGGQQAVTALADAGAQRLLIPIAALGGDPIERIEALAAEVMAG